MARIAPQHLDLHLLQEAVGRERLAVGQLDRRITGERRQAGADRGDHEIRARYACGDQPIQPLGDHDVELALNLVAGPNGVAVALARDQEDRGGERCGPCPTERSGISVSSGHASVIVKPRAPKRLHERRPAERRLMRVYADQRRARLEDAVCLGERRRHLLLIEAPRGVLVAVESVRGDDRLATLRRQLAADDSSATKPCNERFSQT